VIFSEEARSKNFQKFPVLDLTVAVFSVVSFSKSFDCDRTIAQSAKGKMVPEKEKKAYPQATHAGNLKPGSEGS